MNLPNVEHAVVEQEKVTGYLLNPDHRFGASKARFFLGFGFQLDKWQELVDALREHGRAYAVAKTKDTPFGPRYEVDGELDTPSGARPQVRTVWQLDHGQQAPRLITAHPLEQMR